MFAVRDGEILYHCVNVSRGRQKSATYFVLNPSFMLQVPDTQSAKGLGLLRSISTHTQVAFVASQDKDLMREVTQSICGQNLISKIWLLKSVLWF